METGLFGISRKGLISVPDTVYLTNVAETSTRHGVLNLGGGPFDGLSPGSFVGSAGGTALAVNAPSGYTGNLLDLQKAGVSQFSVTNAGATVAAGPVTGTALVAAGLSGATAASRYVGGTVSGAPVSGTFSTGDYVVDQSGDFRICTAGGSPGTWSTSGTASGWTLIASSTLGAAAATITFSSIPSTYRHLRIMQLGRNDTGGSQQTISLQFNGDTASNYNWFTVSINGTTATMSEASGGGTSATTGKLPAGTATANYASAIDILICDYKGTALFKCFNAVGGDIDSASAATSNARRVHGHWLSTAAITSITLNSSGGNYVVGTLTSLYGML